VSIEIAGNIDAFAPFDAVPIASDCVTFDADLPAPDDTAAFAPVVTLGGGTRFFRPTFAGAMVVVNSIWT
jgi:hypothetical protein